MALLWVTNCGIGECLHLNIRDPMPTASYGVAALKEMGGKGAYEEAPEGAKCVKCGHDELLFKHPKRGFLCADHFQAQLLMKERCCGKVDQG